MGQKSKSVLPELKLAIGVPSNGTWCADFGMSLMALHSAFNRHAVKGFGESSLRVIHNRGSILPKQRLEIVQIAREWGASHLLWLDSDQTFPNHLAHALLAHGKPVVGCNVVTKSTPANPTARLKDDSVLGGIPSASWPGKGLERVWRIGTGVLLVEMSVYEKTGNSIFNMVYREDVGAYQGEDWTMCEAIERCGYEIWVDHNLSLSVGHVGVLNYGHDLVVETALKTAELMGQK